MEERGAHFPMLERVWHGSSAYENDYFALWLRPEEVRLLLDEFQRLRRLCTREEYISGLDGQLITKYWYQHCRMHEDPDRWEEVLNEAERILERSVQEDYWIRIELT